MSSQPLLLWKMQLTWDSQIIWVMLVHQSVRIFSGRESKSHCLSPGQIYLPAEAEMSACVQGTAPRSLTQQLGSAATALPDDDSCSLAGFGDRERKTRRWNSVLGAWLSVHGRFCKCFMIWLITCIIPKVPSGLWATYLWRTSYNADYSLACFLLKLFLI